MDLKPRVLAVCFFSSPGSVADNFYTLCRAFAGQSRLSVLSSTELKGRAIEGAVDACYLDFSKFRLGRWLDPVQWVRLVRFVRKHQYDVVFLYSEHPLHAVVCRIATAKRSLFWILDPIPHSGSVSAIVRIYEWAKRSLLARADRIVVACEGLREDVVDRYHVSSRRVIGSLHGVLDNLVFPDLVAARPARVRDILFFGRLEPYKGLDVLLEAVRILRLRGRPVTVTIAGPGKLALPAVEGITIENRFVADRELAELVAGSRIVVMPYRDATGSQVPQTAFVYGTPVVATSVGCLPEYVENGVTGLIVPPDNAEALAGALERLLDDDALWERLSASARAWAMEQFDNGRIVVSLLNSMANLP